MKRTQVFLPDPLIRRLEQMAAKKEISKGEIIRRALEEYFKEEKEVLKL
jgi:metal-responsive CopG/Arc/MetJ family transcriptional regulator